MRANWLWPTLCTVLVTAAVILMTVATVTGEHLLACWALLTAMVGCTIGAKLACEQAAANERLRLEDLAAIMAREAMAAQKELRSV